VAKAEQDGGRDYEQQCRAVGEAGERVVEAEHG